MIEAPLSVYLLFHTENSEGHEVYERLYKLLCRDSGEPFFDGLDIPVFFCSGSDSHCINSIDTSRSKTIVILILVDKKMYICNAWRSFIETIPQGDNILICPIQQYENAFDFTEDIEYIQFISLSTFSVLNNWSEFKNRLFDCLIRAISPNPKKKLKIFISHSKKDKDGLGRANAESLRDYLRKETKQDSFYDVNDIVDGSRFDSQIENAIQESLLIILFTNTYSSREWCRRELLTAKQHRVPAIVVFMVNGEIDRIFPYIGNIPSTIYNDDWRPILNLLFRTALDQYHEQLLLSGIADNDTDILPFSPEALSLSIIDSHKQNVLYPEPPLGPEELSILKAIRNNTSFYSPMQYCARTVDLKEKKIGISVSESEDLASLGIGPTMLRDLTVELSRHILIAKGRMVYGGDLRKDGYTELFKELSFQYGQFEKKDSSHIYFEDFLSWPISTQLDEDIVADYIHNRVRLVKVEPAPECITAVDVSQFLPPDSVRNLFLWGKSLTKMRLEMEEAISARILVGGRSFGFKGRMAGLLEEFKFAKEYKHPIFLLGGFGGIANMICQAITKTISSDVFFSSAARRTDYLELVHYYADQGDPIDYSWLDNLTFSDLRNGLTDKENKRLFCSTNIMEIVSYVIKGLSNTLKDA